MSVDVLNNNTSAFPSVVEDLRHQVARLGRENAELRQKLARFECELARHQRNERIRSAATELLSNKSLTSTERIVSFFTLPALHEGEPPGESGRKHICLKTIAGRAGTSPATMSRTLRNLEAVGVLELERVEVHNAAMDRVETQIMARHVGDTLLDGIRAAAAVTGVAAASVRAKAGTPPGVVRTRIDRRCSSCGSRHTSLQCHSCGVKASTESPEVQSPVRRDFNLERKDVRHTAFDDEAGTPESVHDDERVGERDDEPVRPQVHFQVENDPLAPLRLIPQWAPHRAKVPHDVRTGHAGSSTDPETWGTFEQAEEAARTYQLDGVGFCFSREDPYLVVDLDHCRDPETGLVEERAAQIVTELDSYTEASMSGHGVHIICDATKPGPRCRTGLLEIYETGRFLAVTGKRLHGSIQKRQAAIDALYARIFPPDRMPPRSPTPALNRNDEDVLKAAFSSKHGGAIEALYRGDMSAYGNDHSVADAALCRHLAHFTGGDEQQIDRIMRGSALYRTKWDRADYRRRTIAYAVPA